MNYNIIDNSTGLNIKGFSEKDVFLHAKKNNISKFDAFHIGQKIISKTGLLYALNLEDLSQEAVLKNEQKNTSKIAYFNKYSDLLEHIDKK